MPECARVFPVAGERLGRNVRCPGCGTAVTARPVEIETRLREQQQRVSGLGTSPVPRLPFAVLVDDLRSLWNVGSIFRTADACGVGRLVLCGITAYPPRAEIAKTALGAEAAVPWRYRAEAAEALDELQAEGFVPVALESTDRAVAIDAFAWPRRPALVIGNEVTGISTHVLAACESHLKIPMRGVKDSLNVAVAFGIAAHAAASTLTARAGAMRRA